MIEQAELLRRVKEAGEIRRWYQHVPYGNVLGFPQHFDDGKTNKESFGDGRWRNYVRPMIEKIRDELDPEGSTFCDIGCNAGLYLLRAWEQFGFKRLIGLEAAPGGFQQLLITKDYYDTMPLEVYNVSIGQMERNIRNPSTPKIDMHTFPISDLTIIVCSHYHFTEVDLRWFLHTMLSKTLYLMVVTDENAGGVISARSSHLRQRMKRIRGWTRVGELKTPREKVRQVRRDRFKDLTTLLFKNAYMKRLLVKDSFKHQMTTNKFNSIFYRDVFPRFIKDVLEGRTTEQNYTESEVYKWQRQGLHNSTAWSPKIAKERTLSYLSMVKSVRDHGQEMPIRICRVTEVDPWDGHHRIGVLNYFGIKYVYGR
jgi:hypothetical protein